MSGLKTLMSASIAGMFSMATQHLTQFNESQTP